MHGVDATGDTGDDQGVLRAGLTVAQMLTRFDSPLEAAVRRRFLPAGADDESESEEEGGSEEDVSVDEATASGGGGGSASGEGGGSGGGGGGAGS